MSKRLNDIVSVYYEAKVLGKGSTETAFAMFDRERNDPAFMREADLERKRCYSVTANMTSPQCYASKVMHDFLVEAFARPAPLLLHAVVKQQSPATVELLPSHPKEDKTMPPKLGALADLGKSAIADVEKRAEAALNKLNNATDKAHGAADKLTTLAAEIEKQAGDIENFVNQTSNNPPA